MEAANYLRSLDWSTLQVLFGLGFARQDVDDTIEMATRRCEKALTLMQTRCLFSTNLCAYLLNNVDDWPAVDLSQLTSEEGLSQVKAINIEIDVTSRLDHMFILAYLGRSQESPTGWYIIQSYVNQYRTIVEPIDALALIQTIQRWRTEGVDPNEWQYYFHANMPSNNVAIPHVYFAKRVFTQNLPNVVNNIYNRVRHLWNKSDSYLHNPRYRCILSPYIRNN